LKNPSAQRGATVHSLVITTITYVVKLHCMLPAHLTLHHSITMDATATQNSENFHTTPL